MQSPFSARTFADRAKAKSQKSEEPAAPAPQTDSTQTPRTPFRAPAPSLVTPPKPSQKSSRALSRAKPGPATDAAPDQIDAPATPPLARLKPAKQAPGATPLPPVAKRRPATVLTPQPPAGALRLVPLQALAKGGRWRTEAMRSYRMPVLLWFTRGQGRITVAGVTRGYGAHNAIFVPPGCMHGFEVSTQVYGTAIFFSEAHALPLPDLPRHLRIRDAVAQGELTTVLEQLSREIDGDRPFRERAIEHQAGLLSVWLDRQIARSDDAQTDTAARRLMRRFTEAVEAQLYTGQGVSDYAEALGVTPTHLSRVCRETAGRSASDILADRATFEARRMLAETTLPVKQVAQVLGYGSAAYFTRAFQNRTGQTPTQFRAGI